MLLLNVTQKQDPNKNHQQFRQLDTRLNYNQERLDFRKHWRSEWPSSKTQLQYRPVLEGTNDVVDSRPAGAVSTKINATVGKCW